MEKVYVVVTVFTPPAPRRDVVINTYGPYVRHRAQSERKRILKDAALQGYSQYVTVKTSQLIDLDMNAALDALDAAQVQLARLATM